MDFKISDFQCELTDLVIRISSLNPSTFHQALLIHKVLLSLHSASEYLDKYFLESLSHTSIPSGPDVDVDLPF